MEKIRGKKWTIEKTYFALTVALIAVSVLIGVFVFYPSYIRFVYSIRDFGISVAFYFCELVNAYEFFPVPTITPTVTQIPEGMTSLLPIDFEIFKAMLKQFGALLIDKNNFDEFLRWFLQFLTDVLQIVVLFSMPGAVLYLILFFRYKGIGKKPTQNPGEQPEPQATKPLRIFLKFKFSVIDPVRTFVKNYVVDLKENRKAIALIVAIWLFNLNLATIFFEWFAFLFWFSVVNITDIPGLYANLVKLTIDFSISFFRLPLPVQLIMGYLIFDLIRQKMGKNKIEKEHEKNKGLLSRVFGWILIVGKQRIGKTKLLTAFGKTQEEVDRDNALQGMQERRVQFPFFPWNRLEKFLRGAFKNHSLYTKEGVGDLIEMFEYMYAQGVQSDPFVNEFFRLRLKNYYGYEYDDFLFGYNEKHYSTVYDNGIELISIFVALEAYAQLYFIYDAGTSLLFTTYGVRSDWKRKSLGYFPKNDFKFWNRKSAEMSEKKFSHILNFDSVRPGKMVDPHDPIARGLETGVILEAENDKERGNQKTNKGIESDAEVSNVANDLYELDDKMHGHIATIDYRVFFRKFKDSQRADALSADNTQLCNIFEVEEVDDTKILMPFFHVEKFLYTLQKKLFEKIDLTLSYSGNTMTLFYYFIMGLYLPIQRKYERTENRFGMQKYHMKIRNGLGGEIIEDNATCSLLLAQVYGSYATDAFRKMYHKRVMRAEGGLNDFETYRNVDSTVTEYRKQNSHFCSRFLGYFDGTYDDMVDAYRLEKAQNAAQKDGKEQVGQTVADVAKDTQNGKFRPRTGV